MTKATATSDFLAVIFIGGGSSYGRSKTKAGAIKACKRALRDWRDVFDLKGSSLTIHVIECDGFDEVTFDYQGFTGKPDGKPDAEWQKLTAPIEHIAYAYQD